MYSGAFVYFEWRMGCGTHKLELEIRNTELVYLIITVKYAINQCLCEINTIVRAVYIVARQCTI
jgi:hypothetical protein